MSIMRLFDLLITTIGLIILFPVFLLLAVSIKLSSPGSVFYHALRVGKNGQAFRLYKFRTMVVDADKQGPAITPNGDNRITSLGRILRRTKLDELPQLINVLKGDMSLVGPRPEDPRYVALYTPEQRQILQVRPGITSAASLFYRHEEQMLTGQDWEALYCATIMPSKLAIDLDYLAKRSVWKDITLILRTLTALFHLKTITDATPGPDMTPDPTNICWLKTKILKRTSTQQILPLILWDGLGVFFSFLAALAFRFDGNIPPVSGQAFIEVIPFIVLFYCGMNILFSLYSHLWHYASIYEINGIAGSAAASTVLLGLLSFLFYPVRPLPLSVVMLGGLFTTGFFIAVRYRKRLLTGAMGRLQRVVGSPDRKRILIVGGGETGQLLVQQLKSHHQHHLYELIGFVDDDPQKLGRRINGAPVLGDRHTIPQLVAERNVHLIVIAAHKIPGHALREILSLCLSTEARVKMLPDFLGTIDSSNENLLVRDITPADLLGRQPHKIDEAACHQLIGDKVVLVTGAAGSIGSELCRQILAFKPACLLLLDNNETGLHELTLSLNPNCSDGKSTKSSVPIVADVTNRHKMKQIFATYWPQIIFHTAAYKHVPLMEQQPDEAIRVNVLGTKIVSELALNYEAERFVFISSDKAVSPSCVMGATKRIGETLVVNSNISDYGPAQAGNGGYGHNGAGGGKNQSPGVQKPSIFNGITTPAPTLFTAVRFGNVLGSRGSVVPTFMRQIERGGPVTITHPEMTRYFMSISEAVSLVIQAAALTQGNDLFMLDMGQEIKIADLAHKMIRLRGLRPGVDIPIQYIGVRPGEKFSEQLIAPDETQLPTSHPKIFQIKPHRQLVDKEILLHKLNQLVTLAQTGQQDKMLNLLWKLVHLEPDSTEQYNIPEVEYKLEAILMR